MNYINKTVDQIKNAKTDNEIKDILLRTVMDVQWDSSIRAEFDKYQADQRWIEHVLDNVVVVYTPIP